MKKFHTSVWAKDGPFGIRPIDSVQEAQIFLDGWPLTDRSPLYFAAIDSLKLAEEGSIPSEESKLTLVAFLASEDALAETRLEF